MIGRRLLALAGALALAACGAPERDWGPPSPALWEVTGAHGERGWLFGTIHSLGDDLAWRTPTFERAIAGSGLLVVEAADIDDPSPAAWDVLARTPGQPPLTERVPRAHSAALRQALEKAGLDEAEFADVETWAAALRLASALREESGEGVDLALLRAGRGHAVHALESVSRQLAIFDRLPPAD
ncbi:MAG TPA: TraB/GumN family protein, partial [Croceibacterium sp.]|nr:TraB/GumN family protein [Croceibacterium sp.]